MICQVTTPDRCTSFVLLQINLPGLYSKKGYWLNIYHPHLLKRTWQVLSDTSENLL